MHLSLHNDGYLSAVLVGELNEVIYVNLEHGERQYFVIVLFVAI